MFPCRITDGNKIHESPNSTALIAVHDEIVHDFRFLDQYAPRIESPFEARIQDHETMYRISPL